MAGFIRKRSRSIIYTLYALLFIFPVTLAVYGGLSHEGQLLRIAGAFSLVLNLCVLFAALFYRAHMKYLRFAWLVSGLVPAVFYLGLFGLGKGVMSWMLASALSNVQSFPVSIPIYIAGGAALRLFPFEYDPETANVLPMVLWLVTLLAGYVQWFVFLPWLADRFRGNKDGAAD